MSKAAQKKIAELAVDLKMATAAQIKACIGFLNKEGGSLSLDRILLDRGLITEPQHEKLIKAYLEEGLQPPKKEKKIARYGEQVVEKGFATKEQVDTALQEQTRLAEQGTFRNLGEILVQQDVLSKELVLGLLEERDQVIGVCPDCGEKYNVSNAYLQEAKCLQDGASLVKFDAENASISVSGTVNPDGEGGTGSPIGMEMAGCRILEQIGRGAMARVYRAKHIALNRLVAVKILSSISKNPAVVKSLLSEARSIARLEHPNIVQVHDVGYARGYFYIVMQLLEGKSLSNRLRDGHPLIEDECLSIIMDVAEGLAAAHEKGIIHRDIKPDNIMLSEKGRAKITDFGLAQDQEGPQAKSRAIAGTPFYMSPEQWRGSTSDPRTDLYSLGIILYRMMTGKLPFVGDDIREMMRQHVKVIPKRPQSVNSSISNGLDAVIRKMVSKTPERRYQSANALLSDLKRYKGGEDPKAIEMFVKLIRCSFCEATNSESAKNCTVCGESFQSSAEGEIELLPQEKESSSKSSPKKACIRCKKRPAVFRGVCGNCRRRVRRR